MSNTYVKWAAAGVAFALTLAIFGGDSEIGRWGVVIVALNICAFYKFLKRFDALQAKLNAVAGVVHSMQRDTDA